MSELKPCPICGREVKVKYSQNADAHYIECFRCGNVTPLVGMRNDVINYWNNMLDEKEELKKEINELKLRIEKLEELMNNKNIENKVEEFFSNLGYVKTSEKESTTNKTTFFGLENKKLEIKI